MSFAPTTIQLVATVLFALAVMLTFATSAPNPAGFAILKGKFHDGALGPLWLAIAAMPPTSVAIVAFHVLP